ncbi:MAG: TlyA family RNA methyltransferase [Firmicutes bacterium]|nr:TlyA family RNA methyltransferase [Bacillota bacterium]
MKERTDILLVSRGLVPTREQARRLIMAGLVYSGTVVMDKPGTRIDSETPLHVRQPLHPFVSRGGLKLKKALDTFGVSLTAKVVLDVGASTGGFTDCALQHGAAKVYSVDVGYGQLAWTLRSDERVKVMERMNFRMADPALFDPPPDAVVMDVSFISIAKLLPNIHRILVDGGPLLTLVKPQFEAGPAAVGKGGIVRDPSVHRDVLQRVVQHCYQEGMTPLALTHSPIRGGEGNIEFLLYARNTANPGGPRAPEDTRELGNLGEHADPGTWSSTVDDVVRGAHGELQP